MGKWHFKYISDVLERLGLRTIKEMCLNLFLRRCKHQIKKFITKDIYQNAT